MKLSNSETFILMDEIRKVGNGEILAVYNRWLLISLEALLQNHLHP